MEGILQVVNEMGLLIAALRQEVARLNAALAEPRPEPSMVVRVPREAKD